MVGVRDPGIVHEDVQAAEFLADSSEHLSNALFVSNIAENRQHADLLPGKLFFDCTKTSLVPTAEDQIVLFICQSTRNGQSNALRCSGDKRDFSLQRILNCVTGEALVRGLLARFSGRMRGELPCQSDPVWPLTDQREKLSARLLFFAEAA